MVIGLPDSQMNSLTETCETSSRSSTAVKLVFSVYELRSCLSCMVTAVCAFLQNTSEGLGVVFFFLTGQTCFVKMFPSVKQVPHLQMNSFLITQTCFHAVSLKMNISPFKF